MRREWTKVLDSQGKKIRNGDIVQFNSFLFEVHWFEKYTGWQPFCSFVQSNLTTIVGNKFDNPELMERVSKHGCCQCCTGEYYKMLETQ